MSITKNVLLNWYSSMKKNWERFWWFLTWKIDFESQIKALLTPPHYTNSQNSIISFGYLCWFLSKNLSNFVPLLENSTTRITILHSSYLMKWLKQKQIFWKLLTWTAPCGCIILCKKCARPFKHCYWCSATCSWRDATPNETSEWNFYQW